MRVIKFIGIGLHYVVNTVLALLLFGLTFLAIVLLRHGETPVPPQVTDLIDKELKNLGLDAEFEALEIDLRGIVLARKPRIYTVGNTDPIFEADFALVKMSFFRMLIGDFTPTEVQLANGSFYCPTVISPAGERELMIENLYINAEQSTNDWRLNTFILEVLGARVQIDGHVFSPLPGMEDSQPENRDKQPDIMGIYVEVCRELLALQEPFSQIEGLILRLDVSGERQGPIALQAHLFHEGFSNIKNQLKLGAGTAHLRATLDVDGRLRPDGLGHVWLNSLQWEDNVKTGYTEAHISLGNGLEGFTSLPQTADLYCYNIVAWGLPLDGAFAMLDMGDFAETGELKGRVMVKSDLNWLSVVGPFNPKEQSGNLIMEARWHPMYFLQSTALPPDEIPEGIEVAGRPFWRAKVNLLPGFKPGRTEFDVHFSAMSYENIKLEAARIVGTIENDELNLHQVNLVASDYQVTGNYYQQFSTGDYRFQAQGSIWPDKLDIFIPDQWWQELWADIHFNKIPPNAEIDMSGQFGADGAKNHIYGTASLQDVRYKTENVDHARTRIWQRPDYLDLFDFTVTTPEGRASAELHWKYLPDGERDFLSFKARTHVPLIQGATFASPAAIPIAQKFPHSDTPYIDLAGIIYGEHTPTPDELFMKASVFFPGKFEFEDIRFDNGSFICAVTPEQIIVSEGRLGLGGGKAALHTIVDRQPDGKFYVNNAKFNLIDGKLYALYEAIPFLRVARAKMEAVERIKQVKNRKSVKDEEEPRSFEERYAGNVNLFFDTHGQLPELSSFVGSGTIVLKDANLGQLHLLGGLSSFLYSMGMHLGTLNFTNAQSDFTLARSNLHFPNTQISGSTGEIDANGNYDIDNESLDFLLNLHPFGNMQTPIVTEIFTIFSPLADSIEVEVTGTIATPQFKISVSPFAVFTGQNKVENPNEDMIKNQPATNDSQ